MESPDLKKAHYAFSSLVQNFDSFLSIVSTEKSLSFSEYINRLDSVRMELVPIIGELSMLASRNAHKYRKAFDDSLKILSKLSVDVNHLQDKYEDKYVKKRILFSNWESLFQETKLREDLINFLKPISKQLKKIQKSI